MLQNVNPSAALDGSSAYKSFLTRETTWSPWGLPPIFTHPKPRAKRTVVLGLWCLGTGVNKNDASPLPLGPLLTISVSLPGVSVQQPALLLSSGGLPSGFWSLMGDQLSPQAVPHHFRDLKAHRLPRLLAWVWVDNSGV